MKENGLGIKTLQELFIYESNVIEGEQRLNPGDVEAIEYVLKNGFKTKEDFWEVHRILTEHLKVNWSGKWREVNVRVGVFHPSKHELVPKQMKTFIRQLPLMDSWTAYNEFESIHPFQDFNGRMGRLVWLWKALKEGYDYKLSFLQDYHYQTLDKYQNKEISY